MVRRFWSSTVVACLKEFGNNCNNCGANGVKKVKREPNRNSENPKNLKLNPKNAKLTKQIFLSQKLWTRAWISDPKNSSHQPALYCPPPSSTLSPTPRADVQGSGIRKKRFECIMLSNPSDLPTPYPPVYPLPYPQSRGTEVFTRQSSSVLRLLSL